MVRPTTLASVIRQPAGTGMGTPGAPVTPRFYAAPLPAAVRDVADTLDADALAQPAARRLVQPCRRRPAGWPQPAARPGCVPAPGTPVGQIALRVLLAVWVLAGTVALYWTARHALSVRRLARGVGDTVFYGADGKPWFPLDEHRRDVPLDQISPHLRAAVVAVEDHRFYRHPGIDALGIARAAQRNLMRSSVEGGSTLTQQLARTLFLSNDRTYMRKAKEAVLALMIEQQLTKDQILEMYLNRVYFGAGTYGAEAMSRRLFGKRAKDLGAGRGRAPRRPAAGPVGPLAVDEPRRRAGAQPRGPRAGCARRGSSTPRQERAAAAGADPHHRLAGRVQRALRIREGLPAPAVPRARRQRSSAGLEGAHDVPARRAAGGGAGPRPGPAEDRRARACRAPWWPSTRETGDIIALVGGRDFNASPFNRAVRSRRQPGSAFKPFVYAAALERGLSPVSVLSNLHAVTAPGRQEWTPAQRERRLARLRDAAGGAARVQQPGRGRAPDEDRHRRRPRPRRASGDARPARTCLRWPWARGW